MNEPRQGKALDVLADYFDELLAEPAELPAQTPPPQSAPLAEVAGSGTLYRAVRISGFRVLVAEESVAAVIPCPSDCAGTDGPAEVTLDAGTDSRRCADMAALLGGPGAQREPVSHLLLARDCALALRLPAPGEGVRIDDAAVTWRGEGGARPWLGGTLREQRSIFLDLEGLYGMLSRS